MTTPVFIDLGNLSIAIICLILTFTIVWKRYLSRLESRYQQLMDVIAITFSAPVVYLMLNGLLFRWLAPFL